MLIDVKSERVSNYVIFYIYGICIVKEICYGNQIKYECFVVIEMGKLWFEVE